MPDRAAAWLAGRRHPDTEEFPMSDVMRLVADHDFAIGLVGTAVVVLAVVTGFGRRGRGG